MGGRGIRDIQAWFQADFHLDKTALDATRSRGFDREFALSKRTFA